MSENYRPDLNRFFPAIIPGHALLAPNPVLPGKFRIIENGERFATTDIFKTPSIGKLVEPHEYLPWEAPTVVYRSPVKASADVRGVRSVSASDYRYLQQTVRERSALPVLNPENGLIYDFAVLLPAVDLLYYGRIVTEAARCSMATGPVSTLAG